MEKNYSKLANYVSKYKYLSCPSSKCIALSLIHILSPDPARVRAGETIIQYLEEREDKRLWQI